MKLRALSGETIPEGPCSRIVYTLALKYFISVHWGQSILFGHMDT